MIREIKWYRDEIFSREKVNKLELMWNIKFPDIYIDIVTKMPWTKFVNEFGRRPV